MTDDTFETAATVRPDDGSPAPLRMRCAVARIA
jgi:hypothetical protein